MNAPILCVIIDHPGVAQGCFGLNVPGPDQLRTGMNLRATHHGYAYQDLITGIALVDLILGTAETVTVDTKGFPGDLFDDLTIAYRGSRRVCIQIKHTSRDRELSMESFSADGRSLRVDRLFRSVLTDLDRYPGSMYRVLVRDGSPADGLAAVLKPVSPARDPGDLLPGVTTRRFTFDPQALQEATPWRELVADFGDERLRTACDHLTVDTSAPASSLDFAIPGPAERVLLRRAVEELGVSRVPNAHIAPVYAALALAHAATGARALDGNITRERVSPRVGLITDFGAVAEGHPVESALAVPRSGAAAEVRKHIDAVAPTGGRIVVVGEPGTGKSWLCEQLSETYRDVDWIVARHHCWLGAADINRGERVLTDVVVGSLLRQIEEIAPESTIGMRPRFAASSEALAAAVRTCRDTYPERRVLLIVDGLDHVDRVLGRSTNQLGDPSRLLADELATIELPPGACMLIASQPGTHLDSAAPAGTPLQMPRMSRDEVSILTRNHGLFGELAAGDALDAGDERAVVDLVYDRSGGNALYATYLCRYATRVSPLDADDTVPDTVSDVINRLTRIPETATDLHAYYAYLLGAMTVDQQFAIGILALCDFAVSSDDLGEMLPQVKLLLTPALTTLAPVLNSQPALGGLRIHHESFSRHILRDKPESWAVTIQESAVAWLKARGFFTDARAFRHLPGLLAILGRYDELRDLIRPGFVAEGIRAFHSPEALSRVVEVVARESETRLDWPTLITCAETRKAIYTYDAESLGDSAVEYADVVVSVLGADVVAERLVYEGRPTFPWRWGLRICQAVDRAGAAAPWKPYIEARDFEADHRRSADNSDRDGALHLAVQLGKLRLRGQRGDIPPDVTEQVAGNLELNSEIPLKDLVEVFTAGLPAGLMPTIAAAITNQGTAAQVYLALADLAADGTPGLPDPAELARQAWTQAPTLDISGYLSHGISASDVLAGLKIINLEETLRIVTGEVLSAPSAEKGLLQGWLGYLALARAIDGTLPGELASQLAGAGFFRAWMRYTVDVIGIADDVAAGHLTLGAASTAVLTALSDLAAEATPFTGNPRACDLHAIHPLIHETIEKSLVMVQSGDLATVLDRLIAISDGTTTTTNFGLPEDGPLTTNDLLGILSRVSGDIGVDAIHALMKVVRARRIDTHTQYSTIAGFELATARICCAAGAKDEADECWSRACLLLASYGGHKDPTISEILDSIEDLASVDIDAARASLAKLADLTCLVIQHTNGRGTSHFVNSWWEKAAAIDPAAAAIDGADALLTEPGFEDDRAHTAHAHLLENQITTADPIVLAVLRLTVGSCWRHPDTDLALLTRLRSAANISRRADGMLAIVANSIAASYDDQAMMYSSDQPRSAVTPELVDAVVRLGGAEFAARVPRPAEKPKTSWDSGPRRDPTETQQRLVNQQRPVIPEGRAGAVAATRDYELKQYRDDADAPRWDIDALANAIGWRIIEATLNESAAAGIELIDDIAREVSHFSNNKMFAIIGEGLAIRCDGTSDALSTVASYCLTLAYARIRGGGGWRAFAGREQTHLWAVAHDLDPATAERTLAASLAGAVEADAESTYGVTLAVVAAFAARPTASPRGTAVACWEAAYRVIEHRLPGKAESYGHTYRPTISPDTPESLDTALATLAVATISHPMRADLRQTLVAAALLVALRPAVGQAALVHVLEAGLDAGRTTWLLDVLRLYLPAGELTEPMAVRLTCLAKTNWLSVRSLSAQILKAHGLPVPDLPVTDASRGAQALSRGPLNQWGKTEESAAGIVDTFIDDRLQGSDAPPGLREAVIRRLSRQLDGIGKRIRQQASQLLSPSSRRIPDAYFADEESVENELQAAAGDIYSTTGLEKHLSDPREFERDLAQRLAPNARWSVRGTASRVPRPPTRANVLDWSLAPIPWAEDEAKWPPAAAVTLGSVRQLSRPEGEAPRVAEEPFAGWVQLGMLERQVTLATRHPSRPARQVLIATGLEACDGPPPDNSMPLSGGSPNAWAPTDKRFASGRYAKRARVALEVNQGPLAALIDYDLQPGAPARDRGTGLQPFALAPRLEIIALFALRPEMPTLRHVLIDDNGPALVGRLWHGFLIHDGNYSPLEPAVLGTDLILRPDLYDILESAVGKERLSLGIAVSHSEFRSAPDELDEEN